MAALVPAMFLLAMSGYSSATYCVCKQGVSDSLLQKAIDYACGSGADCSPVLPNGPCYTPNTLKNHCDYAVNSYFQSKGQVNGSCDFAGTATPSATVPTQAAGCVYPSTSQAATPTSTGGSAAPTTSTTTGANATIPTYYLGPSSTTGTSPFSNSAATRFLSRSPATSLFLVVPLFSLPWAH